MKSPSYLLVYMKQLQVKEELMCDINEESLTYLSGIRSLKSGFNYLTNYCVVRSGFLHIKKHLELKHITKRRPKNTF